MKTKKWMALALTAALSLSLAACGGGNSVYVQSVAELMGLGGIAPGDRFAGVVVSEHVAEIPKDTDKSVAELFVQEGDDVKEGQELFVYDTEQLQLNLDKQRLELEQLKASIESYKEQIKQLEQERNRVGGTAKLQYTVQIQTTQIDLKEAELKIKSKETEVEKSEDLLENSTVVAPVVGRVRSINENNGTDQNGNLLPYITIQQAGAYRVKGILGELQRGAITEGSKIRILSRTSEDQTWTGTVALVDFENPIQNNGGMGGMMMSGSGSGDDMSAASKYPFYVELDSTEGLLLGQHVYMEMDTGDGETPAVSVPGSFLMMEEDGSGHVWMEKGGKLTRQAVEVGEYNPMTDTYAILSGLTVEDYIAFPDDTVCHEGASTTHDMPEPTEGQEDVPMDAVPDMGMDDMGDMGMDDMAIDDMIREDLAEMDDLGEPEAPVENAEEPVSEGEAERLPTEDPFADWESYGSYDPSDPSEGGV